MTKSNNSDQITDKQAHLDKAVLYLFRGQTHYENTPIQIYRKFHPKKLKMFR